MVHTVATFNSIKVRHQGGFPGPPWSPSSCPAPVFSKALVLVSCVSCSSCHSPGSKGVLVTVNSPCAAGAMISSPSSAGASWRAGRCGERVIWKAVKALPDSLGPRLVCPLRTGSYSHTVLRLLPRRWCHQDQSGAADVGLCPLSSCSEADAVRRHQVRH